MESKIIDRYERFPYSSKCGNCGKVITVYTQEDRCPEYITEVFVLCECGNYVEITIPVN